jgi:hypothetical protein
MEYCTKFTAPIRRKAAVFGRFVNIWKRWENTPFLFSLGKKISHFSMLSVCILQFIVKLNNQSVHLSSKMSYL